MINTRGINHIGLSVRNLDETVAFFTEILGWSESGRDETYPRSAVSDGRCRLTLWQVADPERATDFDRRSNIGLHHLAIEVESEDDLWSMSKRLSARDGVTIEFPPEPMGSGPRMHMMFAEPGGIRLELIWPGPA